MALKKTVTITTMQRVTPISFRKDHMMELITNKGLNPITIFPKVVTKWRDFLIKVLQKMSFLYRSHQLLLLRTIYPIDLNRTMLMNYLQ
jgi:hypothetical protein